MLHRRGVMRLATAADEILPLRDPRVQQNQAYLDGHRAGARDHAARAACRRSTPASSKGCSPPISNICSASTRRSTAAEEPTVAHRRAGAPATAARREGCRRWGKPEGLPRGRAVRGDGLHRLPLPLEQRDADDPGARRAPALVPRDLARSTARSTARPTIRSRGCDDGAHRSHIPASASWSRSTRSRRAASPRCAGCSARPRSRPSARAGSTTTSTSS